MRLSKQALLDAILPAPQSAFVVLELAGDGIGRRTVCPTEWAVADHLARFRPSNRIVGLAVASEQALTLPDPGGFMDELLLSFLFLIARDETGVPTTATVRLRGDESRHKTYPFFLMPEEFELPVAKGADTAILLFNGAGGRSFTRETMKLARDAGYRIAATEILRVEKLTRTGAETLGGRLAEAEGFDTVIFARDPGGRAIATLTRLSGKRIITREDLIVSIFEKRADGQSGKLKAAASATGRERLEHHERSHGLSRITGGVGARGPGETVQEERKRSLKVRQRLIRTALDKERGRRENQRKFRAKTNHPTVAIVGYTNAGKSTLFNAILGEKVVRESGEFFSSIDPKIRLVSLFGRKLFLLDTVGFIEGMSQGALDAFEQTFTEILNATLILQVVDPTDREWRSKKRYVDELLDACGVAVGAVEVLYSKRDLLKEHLPDGGEKCYAARDRDDLRRLKRFLFDRLFGEGVPPQ